MFNKSEIMQAAWTVARRFIGNRETWGQRLSRALKSVWWTAKQTARINAQAEAARLTALALPARSANGILAQIIGLENTDHLGWAGMQSMSELRAEYQRASAAHLAA